MTTATTPHTPATATDPLDGIPAIWDRLVAACGRISASEAIDTVLAAIGHPTAADTLPGYLNATRRDAGLRRLLADLDAMPPMGGPA